MFCSSASFLFIDLWLMFNAIIIGCLFVSATIAITLFNGCYNVRCTVYGIQLKQLVPNALLYSLSCDHIQQLCCELWKDPDIDTLCLLNGYTADEAPQIYMVAM